MIMIKWIRKIQLEIYFVFVASISFYFYTHELVSGLMIFYILLMILHALLKFKPIYILVILLLSLSSIGHFTSDFLEFTLLALGFLVVLFAYMIRLPKIKRKKGLKGPIIALYVSSLITFYFTENIIYSIVGVIIVSIGVLLYYFFIGALNKDDDHLKDMTKIYMYVGTYVFVQLMYFVLQSDIDVSTLIRSREISISWENINNIGFQAFVALPLIAYQLTKSKFPFYYMLFFVINFLVTIINLSRSMILSVGLYMIFLIPLVVFITPKKKRKMLFVSAIFLLLIVFFTGYYLEMNGQVITNYLDALFSRDLTDYESRFELLIIAWDLFKEHPIIGYGGIFISNMYLDYMLVFYHNIFAQVTTMGILGLGSFIYLITNQMRIIHKTNKNVKWFLYIVLVIPSFVNGFFQPHYFYPTYLGFIFSLMAIIEVQFHEHNDKSIKI
jgi:hypothetical protein